MTNGTVNELRKKSEAAGERIRRQLAGMEAHRADPAGGGPARDAVN